MSIASSLPTLAEVDAELARRQLAETAEANRQQFQAHAGPQQRFLGTSADIAIFGGAAGGGKTWSLLVEALRHRDRPGFDAVIFRRTYPQISNPGGLWDESLRMYRHFGGIPRAGAVAWAFPAGGAAVKFAHLQHPQDRFSWKGASIGLLGFDQLEEFEEEMFWYLLSRNRSICGVRPYLRGTCNPVPEDDPVGGWLNRLLAWWIGPEGLPIPERSGVIRWIVREGDQIVWGDSREILLARFPQSDPKSFTFIPGTLQDNPAMERADPGYRGRLMLLPLVERERLLGGNWKVRATAGKVFNRAWFEIVDVAPTEAIRLRYWDKAGVAGGGDYSAGVRMAHHAGVFHVEHVIRGQWSSQQRNLVMRQTAEYDGPTVPIWVEQEGGSGGKESAEISIRELAGWMVRAEPVTGKKPTRAGPLAAQAEAGNVKLIRGQWNEDFLHELHGFPEGGNDDQVDAASGAFNKLALRGGSPSLVVLGEDRARTPEEEAALEAERRRAAAQVVIDQVRSGSFPGDR